jgi:hypothetical protein
MIDSEIKRPASGFKAVFYGLFWQVVAGRRPAMLEAHASQSDDGKHLVGFSKAAVFHVFQFKAILEQSQPVFLQTKWFGIDVDRNTLEK